MRWLKVFMLGMAGLMLLAIRNPVCHGLLGDRRAP